MKITDIRPRRKGLSAVYIDGEYALSLDTQTLLEHRIDIGREFDDEELHDLIESSNERRAKEKALWLISYRSHSKKELRDKISRTCDRQSAEKAVERMEELGLVNDRDYAERCAQTLIFTKHMSKRGAAMELRRKGIESEIIDEVLDDIEVDEREQIQAVIERKYPKIDDEKIRRRAVAALQRLGYGWEDIKAVIESF
ncbi:MAG: RecX family transcriptional regulator [Ruminococcus sp.]|uniref:regulatory protein RecX n=1 Tax=unclassified Ruminococcus TaxID=2608920 RepID=UPI00164C1F9A|nr:RecX family transcriptional regulator [uncultured Ruminococcus sp.]MBQ1354649.1 RecX family transcriptional regulator [Ruminococcus sp.]MBQ1587207.1 RecX family transcriptional regulator [Ruminococcus sp.]MBQ1829552.1 RecX family transcriptional regulator [Ruminococcus sp.]MBQ1921167.1 RecX family transcriptional regulator [Ruminococcus sp.]MBQ2427546.1 RecX family transcriptional regulator [Ruminococcus sp.]